MRKLLLAAAAMLACAIVVPLALSSSHREAPGIALDPSADNTDTYAWTATDAPGALTIAADWIPGEVPANGPNFHSFDDRARYYIHVDNTGDGPTSATGSASGRRSATRTRSCTRCRAQTGSPTRS